MINGIGSSSWSQFRYKNYLNQGTPIQPASQTGAVGNYGVTGMSQTGIAAKVDSGECRTCQKRKYQDSSNDPGGIDESPYQVGPR